MRLYPPVITAAAAGAMVALDRWAPMARMWAANLSGLLPAALGLVLILWAAATLMRAGTTLHPHARPSALVRSGPFAVSRNPIYLGFALILAGLAASLGSSSPWAAWAAWLFAMNHLFIRREEDALAAAFGDTFTAYAAKVRRWL
jgi:protein-S-isoprenylcysteine O-methyltransferase Ste14